MTALAARHRIGFLSALFGRDLDSGAWFVDLPFEIEFEEEEDEIEEFVAYWSARHNRR